MLFFLYGEDDYRSQEKLQEIKNRFIKAVDESGYNIVVLDEKINVEKLNKEFSQTGFLARKKLIIIKHLFKQQISKELEELILNYLNKLQDYQDENIIVFYEADQVIFKDKALNSSKMKIFKKLKSFKYNQEFKKLSNYKIIEWIQEQFQKNAKFISQDLANYLLALLGNDLRVLSHEISKISSYNQKENIQKKSIDDLVSASLSDDIFLLSDQLASKNKIEAMRLLNEQLSLGVNAIYLLTMIIRQFRILLQIKSASNENISENNLAQYLGLHPFVIKKSMNSVNLYSLEDLKEIYRKLLTLELEMKSSKLKTKTLLNLFVLNF